MGFLSHDLFYLTFFSGGCIFSLSTVKEVARRYSNRDLCRKCSDDGGTLNNMQTLIIPMLNDEVEEFKELICALHRYSRIPGVRFADECTVKLCREIVVENLKAIREFYLRFPDIPRTYSLKWFKRGTHFTKKARG